MPAKKSMSNSTADSGTPPIEGATNSDVAASADARSTEKPAASKKPAAPKKPAASEKVTPAAETPAPDAAPADKPAPEKKKKQSPKAPAAAKKKPAASAAAVPKVTADQVAPETSPAPEPKKTSATDLKASAELSAKKPALAPKNPVVARKSSVVDFPAPPPQPKPPFVPPPKPAPAETSATNGHGTASHPEAFIQKQRQRLLDLRDELVDAMSGMTRDTIRNAPEGSEASGSGMHQGDAGSDAYDRDFALSVLAKEQDALYEIEQALRRIQKGSYGICEMSAQLIPVARLEVIPFARLTVDCQAKWEKEYGNRRFRPSNEVGFSGGNHADDEDSETVSLDEDDD